jgi:hypothetical protein
LVYFHSEGASGELCLNGDGKISHQLWVLLALSSCLRGKRDGDTIPILKTLKTLLAYQIALESGSETSSDVAEAPPGKIAITSHIADLAHSITDLCLSRKDQLGKEGVGLESHGDISDMLDVSLHGLDRAALYAYSILGSTGRNGSDEISDIRRHERTISFG